MNERGEKVNLGGSRPPGGESAPKPAAKRKPKAATGGGGGGSSAPQSTPTPEPIKLTGEEKKLHGSLVRFHAMIGMGVQQVGRARRDPNMAVAGVNIVAMASDTADSWMELAQQNPAVKKALSGLAAWPLMIFSTGSSLTSGIMTLKFTPQIMKPPRYMVLVIHSITKMSLMFYVVTLNQKRMAGKA